MTVTLCSKSWEALEISTQLSKHHAELTAAFSQQGRDAVVWFWTKVQTWTFQNRTEVQSKVQGLGRTGPQVRFWVQARFKISEPCWTWFEPNFFGCLFCISCNLEEGILPYFPRPCVQQFGNIRSTNKLLTLDTSEWLVGMVNILDSGAWISYCFYHCFRVIPSLLPLHLDTIKRSS